MGEDKMNEGAEVILGRLLAMTEEIKRSMDRLVFRQDNLEVRVESLEKSEAVRANSFASKVWDRALWASLAIGATLFLKKLGIL